MISYEEIKDAVLSSPQLDLWLDGAVTFVYKANLQRLSTTEQIKTKMFNKCDKREMQRRKIIELLNPVSICFIIIILKDCKIRICVCWIPRDCKKLHKHKVVQSIF